MTSSTRRVIVVGAGIAGLTAAFRLHASGVPVTVLERDAEVGGRMSTVTHHGYRIDLGASGLSENYRDMLDLIAETGLADRVRAITDPLAVLRAGRVHYLRPDARTDLVRTGLLSWRAKLRALRLFRDTRRARRLTEWGDLSALAALDDDTVAGYASRHLGEELLEYLIEPVCAGFFLRQPEELSANSVFVALAVMLGEPVFTFDTGIGTLPRRLASQLDVVPNARVLGVEERNGGVRVRWAEPAGAEYEEEGAACVVAVPATEAARLCGHLAPAQRRYLADLPYGRTVHVFLELDQPPEERALLVFVPRREHPDLAVVFSHRTPERVPPGKGLLALCFRDAWSARHQQSADDEVTADALDALDAVLPHLADQAGTHLEAAMVHRWPQALLAREAGGYRRLQRFSRSLDPLSRVQLAGDYFSLSTTNSSLASGERAASRVLSLLDGR